jgi:cyanophycin synthetase
MNKQGILPTQPRATGTPPPGIRAHPQQQTAVFSVSPAWVGLAGCAFGIPQAVLRGSVTATDAVPAALDALEAWMERTLGAALPEAAPHRGSARAVAWRALHWAIAVQRHHGMAVCTAFELREGGSRDDAASATRFFVALPSVHADASRAALGWVERTIAWFAAETGKLPASQARGAPDTTEYTALGRALSQLAPKGQNRPFILQHALDTGIPVRHVFEGVWRLGTGRAARLLDSSITDRTPSIGVKIAGNKVATAALLRQAGMPAPVHELAANADDAVRIANRLGYPVVVKPADKDGGLGVFADLRDDAIVRQSFDAASRHSRAVLVEKHFDGVGHRFTVFGGRVVKATHKRPGGVVGEGGHSIAALVALAQQQARDAAPPADAHATVTLDDEACGMLAQQGLSPQSVVADGVFVSLRRRNNAAAGGTTTLLDLATVHPDNLLLAVRAAQLLGLDWAGIDLLMEDAARSWLETGALICEVNAAPQVDRRTAGDIVDALMGGNSRIPLHLVSVDGHVDLSPDGALGRLARKLGCHSLSSAGGVWIGGGRVAPAQDGGFQAAQILLANPLAESGLCAMTAAEIVRCGLPVDRFDSALTIRGAPLSEPEERTLQTARWMIASHLPNRREQAPASAGP